MRDYALDQSADEHQFENSPQGIETDTTREVSRSIAIDKVPDAVRALGWFPTELQIEELLTEIKFSKFHKTQEQTTLVDLDDFIKLYLNHRPGKGYYNYVIAIT